MLSRLRSALASRVFLKEEEAHYTARFVACLLPVAMMLALLFIVFPLMAGSFAQRLAVGVPVVLALAASWWLLRRGKVRLASLAFVASNWVVATHTLIMGGGVRAPGYIAYLVIATYAAFLVTPAAALAVFILSVSAGLAVVVAAYTGRLPLPVVVDTPLTLYASYTVFMLLIILIVLVITAEYRDAFGRLRDWEARLRALFAAMRDVILVVDAEGRCLEVAPTQPEPFYHPAEEVLGKTVHEIFPAEQADCFLNHIRQALATGQTTQFECTFVIGGQERCFSTAISSISPNTAMMVVHDVTAVVEQRNRLLAAERARAELAEHLNDEINHRARNNLAMASGLLQAQASQEANPRAGRPSTRGRGAHPHLRGPP